MSFARGHGQLDSARLAQLADYVRNLADDMVMRGDHAEALCGAGRPPAGDLLVRASALAGNVQQRVTTVWRHVSTLLECIYDAGLASVPGLRAAATGYRASWDALRPLVVQQVAVLEGALADPAQWDGEGCAVEQALLDRQRGEATCALAAGRWLLLALPTLEG